MTLLTNRLTDEQREELRSKIGTRKPEKSVSRLHVSHSPTDVPLLPTKMQRKDISSNHHYNPTGANIGLNTRYKGGCCGG